MAPFATHCNTSAWPPNPRELPKSSIASLVRAAAFLPLLGLAIPFAVLTVFMIRLNGQPISSHGTSVFEIMGLASTLWPIAFAAVLGSLARAIALYKAEKGTNLGTIGVLLGSQTLLSTLTNAVSLRILSVWVLLLSTLWTFSPAGGQAVLRAIRVTSVTEVRNYDLTYSPRADVGIPFNDALWLSGSFRTSQFSHIYPIFGAALSAPGSLGQAANGTSALFDDAVQQLGGPEAASLVATRDLWENMRVPQITSLPGYHLAKPYEWLDVPRDQLVTYESLIGIPIRGLPLGSPGNLTVQVSATYVALECSPWFNTTEWLLAIPGGLYSDNIKPKNLTNRVLYEMWHGSAHVYMDVPALDSGFNFSAQAITSRGPITRGTLVFGNHHNSTVCDINQIHVDVDAVCERLNDFERMACRANRVRHSPSHPISKPDDQLLPHFGHGPGEFIANLPSLAPTWYVLRMSPLESYLADPAQGISFNVDEITDQFTKLPLAVFSERLSLLINTALRASWSTASVLNIDMANITYEENILRQRPGNAYESSYGNTTGQFTSTTEVYQIQKAWMVLFLLSLAVMLAASAGTIALRLIIRAPDFLTHVAALTRDSKHMSMTPGGSTLSGEERARLLKDVPLKIRDVQPDESVGYIALSDELDEGAAGGLGQDGRVYK
ncbi:hypothetical protein BKA56DRAFT_691636 [Ilyonectria sp. MPI-CAGE-AT-0026]|nr:hypothetical protein BKA56DRAFT_691636 [Ilyonectria sp. MPI-CAGE-AT-0026]